MSDYDADILAWSEHQGALLKRLADGERVNDQVDWPNVVEEIESVGRSELRACESLLLQALINMLKAEAWPLSLAAPGWQAEALRFRFEASRAFSPSMRQRLDVDQLYQRARRMLPETINGQASLPVPETSPVTLDELLSPGPLLD
jgi:uncharacterized protein DUF29